MFLYNLSKYSPLNKEQQSHFNSNSHFAQCDFPYGQWKLCKVLKILFFLLELQRKFGALIFLKDTIMDRDQSFSVQLYKIILANKHAKECVWKWILKFKLKLEVCIVLSQGNGWEDSSTIWTTILHSWQVASVHKSLPNIFSFSWNKIFSIRKSLQSVLFPSVILNKYVFYKDSTFQIQYGARNVTVGSYSNVNSDLALQEPAWDFCME